MALVNSSDSVDSVLNEVLEGEIIDSLRAKDNVGTGIDNLLASLLGNVHLLLSDLLKVVGVLNKNLDTHLESELVEVEVNTSDLGVLNLDGHSLS